MSRLVLAVGALVALTLTLSGCGDSGGNTPPAAKIPPIGGYYTSPNVFNPSSGSFAGMYVISDRDADELTTKLHIIGTDDGTTFWNVHGEWTDPASGMFTAYFSHRKDGSPDLPGVLSDAGIAWNNSKVWVPLKAPSFGLKPKPLSASADVGGFYVDPVVHLHPQLFVGTRMIGANYFPNLTFVGTDDGSRFWSIVGRWDGVSQFNADFSPLGGVNTTGKLDGGAILWEADGRYWRKQEPTADHASTITV